MKVGFIGLGSMGLPMAKRLLGAGFELLIAYHKRREPALELQRIGATVAGSPAEVARLSDVVITIVPADPHLTETVFGPNGLAHGFSPGKVLIDMTTAMPATIQRIDGELGSAGVKVLDAPVSGGTTGAAEGTLTIMVGGEAALLDQYRPLLQSMGRNIIHVGGIGQGKVVKMANQLMAAVNLLAMGEAFALGLRCGADPQVLYTVIKGSSGYSHMMDARLPNFLLEGAYKPGFKLDLMKKDVNLALDSAKTLNVPLLLGGVVGQVLAAASAAGHGDEDFCVAAEFLSGLAQTTLKRGVGTADAHA